MKRIKLLIKNVGKPCIEAVIEGDILKELQTIVGGYIDAYPLSPRNSKFPANVCCICNEDGGILGLQPNVYEFLGDIAIVARGEDDFISLTSEQIEICRTILNSAEPYNIQLFELGVCSVTSGANKHLTQDQMYRLLQRHSTGDFGELCEEDIQTNMNSIKYGTRVLSKYTVDDREYYVITEADRSHTTILLTDEY